MHSLRIEAFSELLVLSSIRILGENHAKEEGQWHAAPIDTTGAATSSLHA
jgi:hypothetical protein